MRFLRFFMLSIHTCLIILFTLYLDDYLKIANTPESFVQQEKVVADE